MHAEALERQKGALKRQTEALERQTEALERQTQLYVLYSVIQATRNLSSPPLVNPRVIHVRVHTCERVVYVYSSSASKR